MSDQDTTRDERHIAEFREDGWSLQHPLDCRPNLLDCRIHHAVKEEADFIGGMPVEAAGRYVVTLGPNGQPEYDHA